jgi:Skp family chaperone for outer membrane proteins
VDAALGQTKATILCHDEGFKAFACANPGALNTLRRALLQSNGRFPKEVRQALNDMRKAGDPAMKHLALSIEQLADHLRANDKTDQPDNKENSEDQLLAQAKHEAQAARAKMTDPNNTEINLEIDKFLEKIPRTGSNEKRQLAIENHLKTLPPARLINLALNTSNCRLFRLDGSDSNPYRRHTPAEDGMLNRLLPTLKSLDQKSRNRLTIEEMQTRFLGQNPSASRDILEEEKRLADRMILSTEQVVDIAVSVHKSWGKPNDLDEVLAYACKEAELSFYWLEEEALALGEITSPLVYDIWIGALDKLAPRMPPEAQVTTTMATELIQSTVKEVSQPLLKDQQALPPLLETRQPLEALERKLRAHLFSGLQASAALAALLDTAKAVLDWDW